MKRKRSYAAVDVEQLDIEALLPLVTVGCMVAIDVAKTKFVAAIATAAGEALKLVKFEHPRQTTMVRDSALNGMRWERKRLKTRSVNSSPPEVPLLFLCSNKVAADVYQRHRDTETWCWKTDGAPVEYVFKKVKEGSPGGGVALMLSLSGKVSLDQVAALTVASATTYELTLKDQEPRPTYLRLRDDLARFATTYREALAIVRAAHPGLANLGVFPAVPAPVAVVMGRELLPKVDPVLRVHDFDKVNGFQQRVKVNDYDPA